MIENKRISGIKIFQTLITLKLGVNYITKILQKYFLFVFSC